MGAFYRGVTIDELSARCTPRKEQRASCNYQHSNTAGTLRANPSCSVVEYSEAYSASGAGFRDTFPDVGVVCLHDEVTDDHCIDALWMLTNTSDNKEKQIRETLSDLEGDLKLSKWCFYSLGHATTSVCSQQ